MSRWTNFDWSCIQDVTHFSRIKTAAGSANAYRNIMRQLKSDYLLLPGGINFTQTCVEGYLAVLSNSWQHPPVNVPA